MIIYLAGPIFGKTDDEVHGWRENVKGMLPWAKFKDPSLRDFRGLEGVHYELIVASDKAEIMASDALIVNAENPGWGTAMEILFAWEQHKTVVAVLPPGAPISPWLQVHAHVVRSFAEAADFLYRNLTTLK